MEMIKAATTDEMPVLAPASSLIAERVKLPVVGNDWKKAPPIFVIP
jgi:hypothetical protein